jgi:hypothetical protein
MESRRADQAPSRKANISACMPRATATLAVRTMVTIGVLLFQFKETDHPFRWSKYAAGARFTNAERATAIAENAIA